MDVMFIKLFEIFLMILNLFFIITQMTRNNVCQVGQIPPQGLSEDGDNGVHCMTNTIRRRAK
jgi:hypothetical protein